jgi:general secretion pathway protein M
MNNNNTQRWLAVGLLVTIIILIITLIIVPIISLGLAYRETRRDHIFNLKRYQTILKKQPELTKNFADLSQKYSEQNYFYINETIALASAELQTFITATISAAGGQIIRKNTSSKPLEDNFTRIIIEVNMTVTIDALRTILYDIETATPLIIIDNIRIKTGAKRTNSNTKKLESGYLLTVNFKASSFVGMP